MILVDLASSMFAAIAVELKRNEGTTVDINYLRNIMLKQILSYKRKFGEEYGEMVICLEGHRKGTWRRNIFSNYKAGRKQARIDSGVNWKEVFEYVDEIIHEFKEYLPYKFIQVDGLEGDDEIAILSRFAQQLINKGRPEGMETQEPVLIVANDKDYKQLHTLPYIKQYIPRTQNIIKEKDAENELLELIIRGDKSDGIPNIKSDINSFVNGTRQTPVTTKFIKEVRQKGIQVLSESEMERYKQNESLISFEKIPSEYYKPVIEQYFTKKNSTKMELFKYFTEKGLKSMVDYINQF